MYAGIFFIFISQILVAECHFTSPNTTTFETEIDNDFSVTVEGAYQHIVQKGELPGGVQFSFNERDGQAHLYGIPDQNISAQYPITFEAYPDRNVTPSSKPCSTQQFTLVIENSPCYFETENYALFTKNTNSRFTIKVHDATQGSISIAKGTLPLGISFEDHGDGTADLFGTPTAIGCYEFQFQYSSGEGGCSSKQDFLLLVYAFNDYPYCSTQSVTQASAREKFSRGERKIAMTFKPPRKGPSPVAFQIYSDKKLTHRVGQLQNNGEKEFRFILDSAKKPFSKNYYIVSIGKYGNPSKAVKVKLDRNKLICP